MRGGGGGELLLLLLLLLLRLIGLLGLRLLDTFLAAFLGLGESEKDDDLPRLPAGGRALLGEIEFERERIGLRIGDLLRLRFIGDLLGGGLLTRLGERRLGGGERLLIGGLPRILRGEGLGGDLL